MADSFVDLSIRYASIGGLIGRFPTILRGSEVRGGADRGARPSMVLSMRGHARNPTEVEAVNSGYCQTFAAKKPNRAFGG